MENEEPESQTGRGPARRRIQILAAACLISAATCFLLASRGQAQFVDLHVYRLGGNAAEHGTNLYGPRFDGLPFTYPPFAAALFSVLAVLPWTVAVALITCCSAAMLVLALYLALRLRPMASRLDSRASWVVALAAGTAALWLEPVRTAIGYGQIDLIIAACVLYDLSLPDDAPRKGVAIGFAAGLKLTPAIFVPYLLLTRRYRAAATATAAFACTVAIGWIVLPGSSLTYWDVMFLRPGHIGLMQDASNQSLLGVLARTLHSTQVMWFWAPLALIVAAAGLALAVSAGRRGDEVLGFCLCAITGLLISPISWTHHWAIAVPALLLAAVALYLGRNDRPRWVTTAGGAALGLIAAAGWADLARRMPSTDWLHLPLIGLADSEIYVIAGLATLAIAGYLCLRRHFRLLPGALALLLGVLALSPPDASAQRTPNTTSTTNITINGKRPGAVFDGIGAISGGGGNSRYLIDYPAGPRSAILNFLFGPGGADLQVLKLEIGGDANSSDGSEPSIEHKRGQIDCESGYEWWLAEQAVARDPRIKLYGLQWAAPGWVGTVWSKADVHYVIQWLNCAKSHHLKIGYLGGWNENGYNIAWYEDMRRALNSDGYRSVKIVAADSPLTSAWRVARAVATHPALKASVKVLGGHDTCGYPTTGFRCTVTATARHLGLPLWESELGATDANAGAPDLVRSINNGYIQAGITGYIEWPLIDSMPPGLLHENAGLVTADQPWSGSYNVNELTWATAQTTQFTRPGWRYVNGAAAAIGNSGSYVAYESPRGHDWSLVAENTSHFAGQAIGPRTIHVRLTGDLATGVVRVWATNLWSADPSAWFVRRADIRPADGAFSYSVPPGYVVSFTSTTGQSHSAATATATTATASPPAAMTLPYRASRDLSNEARDLASQEGAFIYRRCLGGANGQCIEQAAGRVPVWWLAPSTGTPTPYAIVGDAGWRNYRVAAKVLFTNSAGRASLIGRFGTQGLDNRLFTGYEASLSAAGTWRITADSDIANPAVLAHGRVPAIRPGTWHAISFGLSGDTLTFSVNGRAVGRVTSTRWTSGLAGIGSDWDLVQFNGLTVS